MFEDCSVFLNDIEVTNANKLYPYSSYFLDLFETTAEAKKSYMSAQLWYENGAFNNTNPTQNPGFKNRGKWFGPREHGMIGKLHSELFHQDRYLLNNVEVKVKLTLGKPGFYFMSHGCLLHVDSVSSIRSAAYTISKGSQSLESA